jgi:hypothetical protein
MLGSISKVRHASLWRQIQKRHPMVYRLPMLWQLFRRWRARPSTHSLWLIWGLLLLNRVLPARAFSAMFVRLHEADRVLRRAQASGAS